MADNYWLGQADAVAQVSTATPALVEIGDIFNLLIDGDIIATFTATAATVANVTDGLVTAWTASTDIRAAGIITATDTTTEVTLTSDIAGMPFIVTATTVDGGGTDDQTLTMATPTASSGPNHWDTAANWSLDTVPVSTDDVIIDQNTVPICWGLSQSGVSLTSLTITQTYTGTIGLNAFEFTATADGVTTLAGKREYRQVYLDIVSTNVTIGEHFGPSTPAGSQRIMLDVGDTASTVNIINTANTPLETGKTAIRLLANNSSTDIFVRRAPGGVGIAIDTPDEVSTVRLVSVSDTSEVSRVQLSNGVTVTTWEQRGGLNSLLAAATVVTVTIEGGTLTTEGSMDVTTGNIRGGLWIPNHVAAGAEIGTLNMDGGTVDTNQSNESRTFTIVNANRGAVLIMDNNNLTIGALNLESNVLTLRVN